MDLGSCGCDDVERLCRGLSRERVAFFRTSAAGGGSRSPAGHDFPARRRGGCAWNPDRARGRQRSGVDDLSRRRRGAGHRVAQCTAARGRWRRESASRPGVVGRRCGRRDQRPTPHPAHRPDPAGGRAHARRRAQLAAYRPDASRRRDRRDRCGGHGPGRGRNGDRDAGRGGRADRAVAEPACASSAGRRRTRRGRPSGQFRGPGHAGSAAAGAAADRPAGPAAGECRGHRRGCEHGSPGRRRWRVRLLDLPAVEPRSLRHRPGRRREPERAQQRAALRRDPRSNSRLTVQAESRSRLAGGLRSAPDGSADDRTRSRGARRSLRRRGTGCRAAHDGSDHRDP